MTTAAESVSVDEIRQRLEAAGQEHVLAFYDELDDASQRSLLEQAAGIDLERVPTWVREYVESKPELTIDASKLEPAPYYPADEDADGGLWDRARFREAGEELLRAGKVAAFTVAGGQGSRLGYDGPKGEYPGGAVTGKPLFQCFAEWIRWAGRTFGAAPMWAIMTSPLNHDRTVAFFQEKGFFGLDKDSVLFFQQGVMPSFDMRTGKILLAEKGRIATNPDGHGGSLKALYTSGATKTMRDRGVEHISYFQVDNPIVRAIDPVFLGLHAAAQDSSAEMSSKMIPKSSWDEKVGVFVRKGGKTEVIEYSDLPEDLAKQTAGDGKLRFLSGSIAIHAIGLRFVDKLNSSAEDGFSLPFHRAEKKVPHIDLGTGERIEPTEPNAVKLETFVFDALPLAAQSIVYETDRIDEFAPIKNAEGRDSPETSARIQTERAARMLEAAGVAVPCKADGEVDGTLEISPLFATEPDEIDAAKVPELEAGCSVALER